MTKTLRLLLAAALALPMLAMSAPAHAQSLTTARVVTTCGAENFDVGSSQYLEMSITGLQCTGATLAGTITVNSSAPPTDVLTGPTNVTGAANVTVSGQGSGAAGLQISGTFTGLAGTIQASVDGTNYVNVGAYLASSGAIVTPGTSIATTGIWVIPSGGYRSVRYHVTAVSTGTAVVSLNASAGSLDPPNNVAVTTGKAVSLADGADVTLGAKADAKSTATDTTSVTIMQVLKEISAMAQAPASVAVTNAGTFAVQGAVTNAGTFAVQLADGADTTLGAKADAKSTATDTTSITVMQVLKEISAMVQAPPSQAVTNAGTFAVQSTQAASTTGGATPYALQAAASTNSTNVKNAAGTLLGLNLLNTNTTIYYLRLYDSASAPTCSSATNFIRTVPVPPAGAAGGAGGIAYAIPVVGEAFANGIGFCVTGGPTSTDNTNAATGVFVNIDYK